MPKLMIHGTEACGTFEDAKNIKIDTISGMNAGNVQEGLAELNSKDRQGGTFSKTLNYEYTAQRSGWHFAFVEANPLDQSTVVTTGIGTTRNSCSGAGSAHSPCITMANLYLKKDQKIVFTCSGATTDVSYNRWGIIEL